MLAHLNSEVKDALAVDAGDPASELRRESPELRVVLDARCLDATRQKICDQLESVYFKLVRIIIIIASSFYTGLHRYSLLLPGL